MTDTVIVRISALEHTRQFVGMLAGVIAALCTIVATSEKIGTWFIDVVVVNEQVFAKVVVCGLIVSELLFLLGVFLLTDSIHNYSKILEYKEPDLFGKVHCPKSGVAHVSALAADDLSYWCIRNGTVVLFWVILLFTFRFIFGPIIGMPVCCESALVLLPLLVALLSVFYCYRVSHYGPKQKDWCTSFWNFLYPFRYKNAAEKSLGWPLCPPPTKKLSNEA